MKPIIIVGMMGAGKTTVGRRLAKRLELSFFDSDIEMEQRCGAPVPLIFELEGEAGFRKREAALIEELTSRTAIVLSTGGGAITSQSNREMIRERGVVIYLRAQLQDIWIRTRHDKRRPLLQTADPRKRLGELLEARKAFYEEVAHYTIDTGRQPAEWIVDQLVVLIQKQVPDATH